jgi:transposase-like protein
VVLELLRGADLDSVRRRHGVTAANLSPWRHEFLAGGEAHVKGSAVAIEDEDTRRPKSVVAHLATTNERLGFRSPAQVRQAFAPVIAVFADLSTRRKWLSRQRLQPALAAVTTAPSHAEAGATGRIARARRA